MLGLTEIKFEKRNELLFTAKHIHNCLSMTKSYHNLLS